MLPREIVTIGSDALRLRDEALARAGAEVLLRTKTTRLLVMLAIDEAVRAARPRFRESYRYAAAAAGDPADLVNHVRSEARLPAPPTGRSRSQAHRRSGYAAIASAKRELLEAFIVEAARLCENQTERSLADIRLAALVEREASAGRAGAADLLLRDCCSLLRHRHGVWDTYLCAVIENPRGFMHAAADAALEYRRHGKESDKYLIANLAAVAVGENDLSPEDMIDRFDSPGPNISWLLLGCLSAECWELPLAESLANPSVHALPA
jgi:hypothetical protein